MSTQDNLGEGVHSLKEAAANARAEHQRQGEAAERLKAELTESFGDLREAQIGRPIGIRRREGDDADVDWVGHILLRNNGDPTVHGGTPSHVVLTVEGDAATVMPTPNQGEEYKAKYGGNMPLIFPVDTTTEQVFDDLTGVSTIDPKHGSITVRSTAFPHKIVQLDGLRHDMDLAARQVTNEIRTRRSARRIEVGMHASGLLKDATSADTTT